MNQSEHIFHAKDLSIALIESSWHTDIVSVGRNAFLQRIVELGAQPGNIRPSAVPGAFELPLHAKLLARSRRYDAIVACGFVVDGGIYRHEFVAHAVIDGLMKVQLDTEVPILSMVLTPQHFHEHETHRAFFLEHMKIKGIEAANACMATLQSLREIKTR